MCELPFHCLARSCHLEVLMVISIDTLLIKQVEKLLNVILVISLLLDKTIEVIILFWKICHLDILVMSPTSPTNIALRPIGISAISPTSPT